MSLGLQATKRRMASVKSTKKITKAMQLVATAKLKTMKKNFSSTSLYADEVGFIMASMMKKIPEEDFNQIFDISKCETNKKVYLIISSTLGLCGGYNYNLFRALVPQIDKENDLLVVIGSKGITYFKNRGYQVDETYADALNNFNYDKASSIAKYLMSLYSTGKCSQIKIAFTHYKNQITFVPSVQDFFPFSRLDEVTASLSRKESDMLVEPDPVSIVKMILPLYLKSVLYSRINEASLSEYSSRRNAMENATDNAEEIVAKLNIQYNKARQAAITQEITEVVGGANASD